MQGSKSRDNNTLLDTVGRVGLEESGPQVGGDVVAGEVGAVEPHVQLGPEPSGLVLDAVGGRLKQGTMKYIDIKCILIINI